MRLGPGAVQEGTPTLPFALAQTQAQTGECDGEATAVPKLPPESEPGSSADLPQSKRIHLVTLCHDGETSPGAQARGGGRRGLTGAPHGPGADSTEEGSYARGADR